MPSWLSVDVAKEGEIVELVEILEGSTPPLQVGDGGYHVKLGLQRVECRRWQRISK